MILGITTSTVFTNKHGHNFVDVLHRRKLDMLDGLVDRFLEQESLYSLLMVPDLSTLTVFTFHHELGLIFLQVSKQSPRAAL